MPAHRAKTSSTAAVPSPQVGTISAAMTAPVIWIVPETKSIPIHCSVSCSTTVAQRLHMRPCLVARRSTRAIRILRHRRPTTNGALASFAYSMVALISVQSKHNRSRGVRLRDPAQLRTRGRLRGAKPSDGGRWTFQRDLAESALRDCVPLCSAFFRSR